ncbi:protein phosphatase 1B-like [Stegodyphus dumicola]|uniref:protein phosphatase 1B-like n=1 Tax=Stegodyphus dumicola TaxID=202533 RepID=UPI0015B2FFE9|nr:protein phosphatase 1B-like [Stegodyphus dumicola]XP_035209803.1 protein phosphatase 1B-like [Stegodyphus dumicola]
MGAFLDKPKTEKHSEHGCGNGLSYGLSSMQGWRIEMEDAHCALVGLPQGLKDWSFFAVFDGHAGARVSAHCAENLLDTIIQSEDFRNNTNANCNSQVTIEDVERVKRGIRDGFLQLDERMRKIPEIASGEDKSGSTAVCTLISSTHFYFANCGDSRAVLSRNKRAFFITEDHKPINPAEKERIQKAGGSVMIQRVNGSLAVSRALGDYEYKQVEGKGPCEQLVSPEPEVDVLERDNELDEFLVLACDGVWDVMTNDEICDHIRYMMQVTADLEYICNCVIDACLCKGSKDNMSIVLVALPGAPKLSEEIIQRDKDINKILEKRTREIISSSGDVEMGEIIRILADDENIRNTLAFLPIGALFFKHSFLEDVCNKIRSNSSVKGETI